MKPRYIFLFAILALLLSACAVTITFVVDPDQTVSANTNPNAPVDSATLAAGQRIFYEVNIATSGQALYLEADANLSMKVYNANSSEFASSSSPSFFASGFTAASLDVVDLAPQQSPVERVACRGSCVIRDNNVSTVFVSLQNKNVSSVAYNFYAFTEDYDDVNEFANDSQAGAVLFGVSVSNESGAIESLGDVDYFEVEISGTLNFDHSSAVNIVADVIDGSSGQVLTTLNAGNSYAVLAGDLIRVYANDNRAGSSSASFYSLNF